MPTGPGRISPLAPLSDPDRLAAFRNALANWASTGYVEFDLPQPSYEWIKREFGNITLKDIARRMFDFVNAGGTIDEVLETRPGWCDDHEFHHDLRLTVKNKQVYIETVLDYRLPLVPDVSSIVVVNIHGA